MKVLIATTNLGKVQIYKEAFDELGIEVCSLRDLDVNIDVVEDGATVVDNAVIKALAYHKATGLPVLANDSGLVIDKFSEDDQPGLLVRRYHGQELTDEEMLQVYIDKLNAVGGESSAHYNVGLAIVDKNGVLHTREFHPKRHFISTPSTIVVKGIPLSSLCFDKSSGKYLSEMTIKERNDYEGEEFLGQIAFIKECFSK
ncbi:MAG: non-canonical purine NTP pyrophosphatase [Clostridia bacterium]|nr:non-canonical purine NTP pyrophosphatase [Clostridia bacterium]